MLAVETFDNMHGKHGWGKVSGKPLSSSSIPPISIPQAPQFPIAHLFILRFMER